MRPAAHVLLNRTPSSADSTELYSAHPLQQAPLRPFVVTPQATRFISQATQADVDTITTPVELRG
jgi:hypothetical protein